MHDSRNEICRFLERSTEYFGEADALNSETGGLTVEATNVDMLSINVTLPEAVELDTLNEIDDALASLQASPSEVRRDVCKTLVEQNYIGRLLDTFRLAEDLNSRDTLFKLYNIFKHLVLLNHPGILRNLLSDNNVLQVAGVFEYDPAYPNHQPDYRQFLLNKHRFKQILPLTNPHLVELVHQTFRAQYLKDCVFPRILDEETWGSILFMIRYNFAEIIELLESEEEFLPQLVPLFKEEAAERVDPTHVLKFMKEFLMIAKTSSTGRNLKLYQENAFSEFLCFLQRMLGHSSETRKLAIDVLLGVTQHDANIIRTFMIENKDKPKMEQLLWVIIEQIINPIAEIGDRWQLITTLRTLLDTVSLLVPMGLALPSDEFLNFFYPDYALRLLDPLVKLTAAAEKEITSPGQIDVYCNCCELLCSFIVQHKYRMKYLLFRSFIVHNVLHLLNSRWKVLQLCAIKLVKTMVATGDDFYFRFLIKQNLFRPILDATAALGETDNALSSALIEFFTTLSRDRKYRLIVNHLVEACAPNLEQIKLADIPSKLFVQYDKLSEPPTSTSSELDNVPADNWSRVDRSQEAYFSVDDDDDDDDNNNNIDIANEGRMNGNEQETSSLEFRPLSGHLEVDEVDSPRIDVHSNEVYEMERNKRTRY